MRKSDIKELLKGLSVEEREKLRRNTQRDAELSGWAIA